MKIIIHKKGWVAGILLVLSLMAFGQTQEEVVFSASGGFYETSFPLSLECLSNLHHVRYTVNGTRPTANSLLYSEALFLDEHLYSKSDIYTILNCPEQDFYRPDSVQHCIVIRAAVFDENDNCVSAVKTNSYFIRALGCETHGLPVVSLCADSLDLFGFETGIMVPGVHFDSLNPYFTGNYFMKGREWERECNIEFYELDNSGINQKVGIRTHGKSSRWHCQKGMKIYAREEYGQKRLRHQFFETIPINNFKHLCLKPFMSAWNGSGSKDYITSCMAQHVDVESLASRASVLFLNGEYWGVYFVAEKPDERFLEDHLNVDIDSLNIIDCWNEVDCGNGDNFYALRTWMEQADLRDETQYAYAEAHIDIANFIDYYILELFSANVDWPASNTRMWQLGNGKWRWIFYDGDACLENQSFDVFANATYDGDATYPSNRRATLFFRRLLENEQFKAQYTSRFHQLVSTTFSYQNTKPVFDHIKQTLVEEVPNQSERFHCPSNYTTWENYCMKVIERFLRERPDMIIEELDAFLLTGVPETASIAFHCYPNPAKDILVVETQGIPLHTAPDYRITNLMGQTLLQGRIEDEIQQINIESLPAGMYFITLGKTTQKIVVR